MVYSECSRSFAAVRAVPFPSFALHCFGYTPLVLLRRHIATASHCLDVLVCMYASMHGWIYVCMYIYIHLSLSHTHMNTFM